MNVQTAWADRGHLLELDATAEAGSSLTLVALSRSAGVAVSASAASFWIAMCGSVEVECREGRFLLRAGEWLSLECGSRPLLHASYRGLVVGIAMPDDIQDQPQQLPPAALFPGRGMTMPFMRRTVLGLCRRSAAFVKNDVLRCGVEERQFWQLARCIAGLQHEYSDLIDRCPGHSQRRKRQVFSRLQRARLYLEGNLGRVVRISELAELSNVSIWHFTKSFQAVYGENPHVAATRIRMDHAARLLLKTELAVSEVGMACGFENNCSFSRAFRASYGEPPSRFRLSSGSFRQMPQTCSTRVAKRQATRPR